MNSDNNEDNIASSQERSRDTRNFTSRRLERLSRGSFQDRQRIERSRQKIRAYKESLVALNQEGRRSAAASQKLENEVSQSVEMAQDSSDEVGFAHRPLPSAQQRPTIPNQLPNRVINPNSFGRFA